MNVKSDHEPLAYSVADAIRVSSIKKTRLYQLIKEGRLEARKVGASRSDRAGGLKHEGFRKTNPGGWLRRGFARLLWSAVAIPL